MPFVENDQDVGVADFEAAARLPFVIEPDDGWCCPEPESRAQRLEPFLEAREAKCRPHLVFCDRMGPQSSRRYHAERALATDEQLRQIGPHG